MSLDLSWSFQILERKIRMVGIIVRFEKSKVKLLCFYWVEGLSFGSSYRQVLETKCLRNWDSTDGLQLKIYPGITTLTFFRKYVANKSSCTAINFLFFKAAFIDFTFDGVTSYLYS